jgi:TonB-linked SusC/RagA family outer membrane protein
MKTIIIPFRGWQYILVLIIAVLGYDFAHAQNREIPISGVVKSSGDANPLVGVSITANNSGRSVMTAAGGKFTLNINSSDTELTVSYVGYDTQKVKIDGKIDFDITLQSKDEHIETVVVTALGIKREERSLGYSVGKVDGESLNNVAQENLLGGISGKVPGVTLNQTGGVGSSISMVIRGATSLSSDNQPLYVVDGVPLVSGLNNVSNFGGDRNQVDYGNPIADINPSDVESISILKGPSAAALYGSRAGNGVVLITTKSGKFGQKTTINFSTNNVFEKAVKFVDFHYKFANGTRPNGLLADGSAYWAGPELDKGILASQWNSPLDANGNKIPTELVSYRDNMKNFLNTGVTNTNNLSISGSGSKVLYRFSLNNMNHKGMIPNSNLYRNGISANITYNILDNLKLSSNFNVLRSNSYDMPATGNRASNPLQAVYNFPHVNVLDLQDYWVPGQENIQQFQVVSGKDNPYFLAYELTNAFKRDRIFGNIKLDWEISNNFSFFFRGAENSSFETRETKIPYSFSRDMQGGYHLQDLKSREDNIDFLFSYNSKDKITDFNYIVSAGANYMHQYNTNFYSGSRRNAGLTVPGLYRLANISSAGLDVNNGEFKKSIYSIYAMANLGYKNQLFLDLTARNDWSSTLPVDNRSYFYPSASLSWVASDTFKLPSSISFLKLRASVAQVGNDTNPYQLNPVLATGRWGDLIYMQLPETLLSPNLKPEIATSSEYGLEYNMFKNRLRFEGTYFTVENKNQILPVSTAQSSGYSSKLINAGKLQSKGWEFALSGTPIQKQDGLVWDVSVNFTNTRTKILELAPGIDYYEYWNDNSSGAMTWVGEEVGNLYSRGYSRVTDPNSEYYNWPILNPTDGSWIQDNAVENRIKVGNFNPKFLAGMQHSFSYKNFHLGFSLDWRHGGQYLSYTYRYGGSDWKSQIQLDKLIPGGQLSPELAELLKSNPGKYIIPQNGNFPRVGGLTKETGGFYIDQGGVAGYDGVFIPGVIAVTDGSGNVIGYKENLGGDSNTILRPASNSFSWNYNQQVASKK